LDLQQNTLYLTTPGTYVARDHLTLQVEVPVYPPDLPPEERNRQSATDTRKLSIPIHHLESVCVFGASSISPPAMDLCWEHGVAINFLSENGYLQARVTGVTDTSVTLRRAQFRVADDPVRAAAIARQIVAGKSKIPGIVFCVAGAKRMTLLNKGNLRTPPTLWRDSFPIWRKPIRRLTSCAVSRAWPRRRISPCSGCCSTTTR